MRRNIGHWVREHSGAFSPENTENDPAAEKPVVSDVNDAGGVNPGERPEELRGIRPQNLPKPETSEIKEEKTEQKKLQPEL